MTTVQQLGPRATTTSRAVVVGLVLLGMTGCATYTAKPLPRHPDLVADASHLNVDAASLKLPMPARHRFDPSNGLDMTEVAMLAVANNPELKAERQRAKIAGAQLFAAKLLPDPQLSISADHPTDHDPSLGNAYGVGLNYDLTALVTRSARMQEAVASKRQVNLEVMWHEWQTVQQARILFVRTVYQQQRVALLREAAALYGRRYARSAKALSQGNLTLDVAGTDLTALMDADSRLAQAERNLDKTRRKLKALLGLSPQAPLTLQQPASAPPNYLRPVATLLKTLPQRRPDLLALAAGYRSQEARVRRAILAQFPSLSVGLNRARDTSNVHTVGLGISLNLPLLNANRGDIKVQRATRAQLRQQYQARIDAAVGEVDSLLSQQALIQQQLELTGAHLPILARMVEQAQRAYRARNIDALTYLNMQSTLLSKQLEQTDLTQARWETRIALDTLLAWPETTSKETQP